MTLKHKAYILIFSLNVLIELLFLMSLKETISHNNLCILNYNTNHLKN